MTLSIDLKYFTQISSQLERCKQRDSYVFAFRCPICGDSRENKAKLRGYVYRRGDGLSFTCHNCNTPIGFRGLLKFVDQNVYAQYSSESFLDKKKWDNKEPEKKSVYEKARLPFQKLSELPSNHDAVKWFRGRMLPEKFLSEFYFVDEFKKVGMLNPIAKEKAITDEPRILIPVWSEDRQLQALVCRDLYDWTDKKYMILKFYDGSIIYGLERLDKNKPIYVVEGPLDSLFIPNCLAVIGTAFGKIDLFDLPKRRCTVIFDNQPKEPQIVNQLKRFIKNGYNVVIWKSREGQKVDINDMVKNGEDPMKEIKERTFNGLMAELEFTKWRKI